MRTHSTMFSEMTIQSHKVKQKSKIVNVINIIA